MPTRAGKAATARSWLVRATALFTPDAIPDCSTGTEPSTAAVNGATITARPSPNTRTPGSTTVRYDASGPIRVINTNPTAATAGPTVIGNRGPCVCA